MKVINEAKQEKLPIEFITSFVSNGWTEVGNIKASIEGIKKEFKGTDKVVNILQDLTDAYLICIGQLEAYLDKKDYVEIPEQKEEKEEVKENLQEELFDLQNHEVEVEENGDDVTVKVTEKPEEEKVEDEENAEDDAEEIADTATEKPAENEEDFEYYCDFDEPEIDNSEESGYKDWVLRQQNM